MALDLKQVPNTPGIYKFISKNKIIYIGKAKNLKKRVSSYFGNSFKDRKTHQIKTLTDKIETFSTTSEAEALLLEQSLIKENLPRFNILLRDDKTYPYVHFSMNHKFPAISIKRSKHAVTQNFFGPFISAQAARSTIKDLQKIYQIRNCSDSTFRNRSRPCIEHQMQRCSAPCVNLISKVDYQTDIEASQRYLASSGKKARLIMFDQMQKLSEQQEYERANEIKKRIKSLDILHQEQSFNSALTSVDLFTCVSKINKTGACILSIRNGRIRGTKTHYLQGNEVNNVDNLFQSLIFSYYQNSFSLPEKILLAPKPDDVSLIRQAVYLKFNKKIMVTTTVNSSNRQIVKLAKYNANQIIDNKVKQSDKYLYGITNIASSLGLKRKHLTIEGYDISHQGGHYAVGSSVRFSVRGPEKSEYRLFNIPQDLSGNDIGSIKYVLSRRISKSNIRPLPDIILIDGGQAQLNAALNVFSDMLNESPIILSIVKGSKRVRSTETILSKKGIIEMSKDNPGFLLLQQIRDESHRFAIKNNRNKKSLSSKKSKIDKIRGIGSMKRKLLFKEFKTIDNLKKTSYEDLIKVPGIGTKLAVVIKNSLK